MTITRARERVYAVSFQEAGSDADLYEGYPSRLGQTTLVNLRKLSRPRPSAKPWVFVRPTLLRPSLLEIAVVSDKTLAEDLAPAALRDALTQRATSPEAYDGFCACVRTRKEAADPRSVDALDAHAWGRSGQEKQSVD